jgi:hypothetical protein
VAGPLGQRVPVHHRLAGRRRRLLLVEGQAVYFEPGVVVRYRKKPGTRLGDPGPRGARVKVATSPGSPRIGGLDRRLRQRGGTSPAYIVEVTGQSEIEVVLYTATGTITFD